MLTFEAVEIDTVIALREELQRHKAGVHFIENPVKNTTMVDLHYPLGLVPSP